MSVINSLQEFIITNETVISGIVGICSILGFFGSLLVGIMNVFSRKRLKDAEDKIEQFNIQINDLKTENAQFAKIINNNYGLSYTDTKEVANDVYDEKTRNISSIHFGSTPPLNAKHNDIWIQEGDFDFGDEDK